MTAHVQSAHELDMFLLHLWVKCPLFAPTPQCIFPQTERESLSKKEKLQRIKAMDEATKREMLAKCDRCYRIEVVK